MDAYADPLHFLPATSRDTSLKHDFTPVGTVNISLKITWDAPEDDVIAETRDEKESRLRNGKNTLKARERVVEWCANW